MIGLEVSLVAAAVDPELLGQQPKCAERGHEGDEREHVYMIGHMFPLL